MTLRLLRRLIWLALVAAAWSWRRLVPAGWVAPYTLSWAMTLATAI